MINRETVFSKDIENKKLTVLRSFGAPLAMVWKAWTESAILDQWWAPKPYRAETKVQEFKEGGFWLYSMNGPAGDVTWCKETYGTIDFEKLVIGTSVFCDEAGNKNPDFPTMHWHKQFTQNDSEVAVKIDITFDNVADLEKIIQMRFQEGLSMGLENLDKYLANV